MVCMASGQWASDLVFGDGDTWFISHALLLHGLKTHYGSVSKPIVPLVKIKIAGKGMFIPLPPKNSINRY